MTAERELTLSAAPAEPFQPMPRHEVICLHDGRLMAVHSAEACASDRCPIHRPSDHRLSSAPLFWHPGDRMMVRKCAHEVFHPDPDDLKILTWPEEAAHECDGCCEVHT